MTSALVFHEFEEKSKEINLRSFLVGLLPMKFLSFKSILKELSESLENSSNDLEKLQNFDKKELTKIYKKYKKYSSFYDRMNDKYYSKKYFNDDEIRLLFKTITRNLHKIENTSYKYLIKDVSPSLTPDYIRDGMFKLSQEAISSKLVAK